MHSSAAEPCKCEQIKNVLQKLEGRPYIWGGEFRNGMGGDCSGLVWKVQRYIGQPVPRTTSWKYWIMIDKKPVKWQNAECSYWVWFQFTPDRPYGHIGIMVKNPKFFQSGSSGGVYSRTFFEGSFWNKNFVGSKNPY